MRSFIPSPRKIIEQGFTLIELLVTVSILSVLLMLAAPSLQEFFIKNTLRKISDDFTQSIFKSKNTAVSKNTCTMMCMSSTTSSDAPSCDNQNDSDWQLGWIVFLNPSCDIGKDLPDAAEDYLEIRTGVPGEYSVQNQSSNTVRRLVFNARGMNGLAGATRFSIQYKTPNNVNNEKFSMDICLDALGRTRTLPSGMACNQYR